MKQEKIFVPHELKTIEVDVEKKIFRVNGENFGKGCTGFNISCDVDDGYKIHMEIDTRVVLSSYNLSGEKTTDYSYTKGE